MPAGVPAVRQMPAGQVLRLADTFAAFQAAVRPPGFDVAMVRETGETWSTTHGGAAAPAPMYYWASAGKTFVAIAILQLVEEGRLKLTDTLDNWAPDFSNAKLITVDHLLHHTSGLYSFQEDERLRAKPGYKPVDEVLAVARAHQPLFCPGRAASYSNTGYVLLGRIIEAIDARPLADALTVRIVEKLDLKSTRILGPGAPLDGIALPVPSSAAGGTADDIRTPGAAGPVVASASDMARFWFAALSGQLTSKASVRQQLAALYPMPGQPGLNYGSGVIVVDVPASPNTPPDRWLGHSGGLPGAKAVIAWSVSRRAVAAVALTGDGPAEALANRLFAALDP